VQALRPTGDRMKPRIRPTLLSLLALAGFASMLLAGSAIAGGPGSPVAESSGNGGGSCKGGTLGFTKEGKECGPKLRGADMRKAVAVAVPATLAPGGSGDGFSYGPERLHRIGPCGKKLALHKNAEHGGCKVSTVSTSCSEGYGCGQHYSCERFVVWMQRGKLPGQSPDGPVKVPGFPDVAGGPVLTTVPFKGPWKLRVYNFGPDNEPLPECVVPF
jgi:hypothetical protein